MTATLFAIPMRAATEIPSPAGLNPDADPLPARFKPGATPSPSLSKPGAKADLPPAVVAAAVAAATASASANKVPGAIAPIAGAAAYHLTGTLVPVNFWPSAGRVAVAGENPDRAGDAVTPDVTAVAAAQISPTDEAKSFRLRFIFDPALFLCPLARRGRRAGRQETAPD